MKEYEFRIAGLDPVTDPARAWLIRDAILTVTSGFTEVSPGDLGDLMVGDGVGYIVALAEPHLILRLERRLWQLCDAWKLPRPEVRESADGPWEDHCFFLVPKFRNPDRLGNRPILFPVDRLRGFSETLGEKLSHPVITVYGEWQPPDSARHRDRDISFMYVLRRRPDIERSLPAFIEKEILAREDCDQETIYLSIGGEATYVYRP
ncbi:MAG: hypothetical protein KGJ84_02150 [Elusimicrobia bacterium]|nr:hypothetical protein [Elusimicrobiota bacterium]